MITYVVNNTDNPATYLSYYNKYESILVNENLPKISEGTPKQISYAESVRSRVLKNYIDSRLRRFMVSMGSNTKTTDDLIAQFNAKGMKSSTLSDVALHSIKLHPIFKMTSAKDILNKYA